MVTLIDILKEETVSLKKQYLEMTAEWAAEQVARNVARRDRRHHLRPTNEKARLEKMKGFTTEETIWVSSDEYRTESKWFWKTPHWHFTNEFVTRMTKLAELHYEKSIAKLAARIEEKGLDQSNLKTVTAHVGVNIETTLTDGEKTVRAFTIIASGEIQRPHYRYLIK